MSNEVYGYAVFEKNIGMNDSMLFSCLDTPLGFFPLRKDELYGFSAPYLPAEQDISFMVTDSPKSKNATYLIDVMDYADEANIGLPHLGHVRLALLGELIEKLIVECNASQVALAVTDSSQIEDTKTVSLGGFLSVLVEDSQIMAPPSCLYIINR